MLAQGEGSVKPGTELRLHFVAPSSRNLTVGLGHRPGAQELDIQDPHYFEPLRTSTQGKQGTPSVLIILLYSRIAAWPHVRHYDGSGRRRRRATMFKA